MTEEGFKYSILASGSSGNSFYLETPKKKLLIDAGLSGKKITGLLAEIDRKPEDLDAILITLKWSCISYKIFTGKNSPRKMSILGEHYI